MLDKRINWVLTILLFLFSLVTFGQSYTVSAIVLDDDTGEPLPYATVRISNANLGTVTNLSGEFDFHVPTEMLSQTLRISMLGYQTSLTSLVEIRAKNIIEFRLKPAAQLLEEVVVEDSLTGGDIMRIALARIEENYPMEPVLMDGFYRDIKKVGDKHEALLEAAIVIYDKNYQAPKDYTKLRERVGIIEIRKSFDYKPALTKYFEQYNLLEDLLLENNVKYRSFNNEPEFYANIQRTTIVGTNGEPMYLLTLIIPGYDLKIYVNKESFAIYRLEFGWGDGETPILTYKKNRNLENNVMRLDKIIEFEPFEGKYYLKYIRSNYKNKWTNLTTDSLETTTELYQELLINKVESDNPEWVKSSQKMKKYGLQFQNRPYNEEFWRNYNVIKATPLDQSILRDLESEASLETQFKNN